MNTIRFERGEGNEKKVLIIKTAGKTERDIMPDIVRHIKNITTELNVRTIEDDVRITVINVLGEYVLVGKLKTDPAERKMRVHTIPYSGKDGDAIPPAIWRGINVDFK